MSVLGLSSLFPSVHLKFFLEESGKTVSESRDRIDQSTDMKKAFENDMMQKI